MVHSKIFSLLTLLFLLYCYMTNSAYPQSGTWTVEQGTRLTNQTSSCTIVLPDGTYRSYLNNGKISTSTDGVTWTTPVTCSGIDATNFWNPSVIYFNNKYILIYEKQTTENGVNVRRLHRATSSDGLNFTATTGSQTSGSIMSPQQSDRNFLSVPDVISLNSTTMRMYFVVGGFWIETATSADEGLTWTREGSITLTGLVQGLPSVDPDIIRLDDGRYQLFFTTNPDNQPGNALVSTRIRSGLSTDGRTFTVDSGDRVSVDNANVARVDADVVKLSNGRYRMYFGEFNSSTPGPGVTVNLRSALSGFLASPDDGAINVSINPTLSWNSLSGVTSYRLQISTNSTFSTLVVNDSTVMETTRHIGPLANNTTYYWRVSTNNGGGSSACSETRSFTTMRATFVEQLSSEIPATYSLDQNYPNPFNPTTKIRFEVPKTSLVRLAVYDILGREVKLLVQETKTAGVYEVEFNASGLPSGTCFYRLIAGSFAETRKMILVK